jgi:hypothetical protein
MDKRPNWQGLEKRQISITPSSLEMLNCSWRSHAVGSVVFSKSKPWIFPLARALARQQLQYIMDERTVGISFPYEAGRCD